jgi:hypothetical protein
MAMFELNPNTNPNDDLADYLPNITIYDLNEWVDRFATLESPAMLSQSGYYGLNFVAEQADKLFWTVGGVIAYVKSSKPLAPGQVSPLEQLLSSERVIQAMNNLFIQLDALADLAS